MILKLIKVADTCDYKLSIWFKIFFLFGLLAFLHITSMLSNDGYMPCFKGRFKKTRQCEEMVLS